MEQSVIRGAFFDQGAMAPTAMNASTINVKLKLSLTQTGRRQYQIAREVGLTENELSRIVRGRRSATADERKRLSLVLGVAEPDLFGRGA
jgi:transcriptional regulator with XRE-family HTH domain